MLDHPFLPTLYASFQTKTHICLITDYYSGGELFMLLDRQPMKVLKENAVRFYAAEVVTALEYLHCQGAEPRHYLSPSLRPGRGRGALALLNEARHHRGGSTPLLALSNLVQRCVPPYISMNVLHKTSYQQK